MADEPRILALRDDLVTTLEGISKANGYRNDYRGVQIGAAADWEIEADYAQPILYLVWDGEVEQDPMYGGEATKGSAPNRFRHFDRFLVTVSVRDTEDPERAAWRIWADIHSAVLGQSNRHRSSTRVNTFDIGRNWMAFYEGGRPIGGVLSVGIVIRWDHLTGDTTSQ